MYCQNVLEYYKQGVKKIFPVGSRNILQFLVKRLHISNISNVLVDYGQVIWLYLTMTLSKRLIHLGERHSHLQAR